MESSGRMVILSPQSGMGFFPLTVALISTIQSPGYVDNQRANGKRYRENAAQAITPRISRMSLHTLAFLERVSIISPRVRNSVNSTLNSR